LNSEKVKILIIQTAFLGDVILALPAVRQLKENFNNVSIDFLCIPETANVLSNNPEINEVIIYDKRGRNKIEKFFEIINKVKNVKYDCVIQFQRFMRSSLISYFTKAPVRLGFDKSKLSFLLTSKSVYRKELHETLRNLEILKLLPDFKPDEENFKPALYPDEKDKLIVKKILSENPSGGKNFITFAPCSKWFTKQLTQRKSLEIITAFFDKGFDAALIGGYENFEYCKQLEKKISDKRLMNLCGRITPLQSFVLISMSGVLVTSDSAAQHLGAASDTPVVLIYGSTDRSFGFYPVQSAHAIVEVNGLICRPCTDHGRKKCPEKHFRCIEDISAEKVVQEALKLIKN
jgi:heptosyltransferase-2